ncbi:hypothetical protein P8C59_005498 [Phyllachora maydis]|uniref:RTR1-type domain-containing protein n=1 Tax=Phyllachora maydis TaxID=1825666 RepID=A0AAD9MEJ8_9PEZI|nr:hypothetical protein P8C59_005498 [Phyllachora maydis]
MSSSTAPTPPKGILKNPPTASKPPSLATTATAMKPVPLYPGPSEDAATKARILATYAVVERLTALPTTAPTSSSSSPSSATVDIALFKAEVTKLTQGEFAELVAERNCEAKCGYALCPRPRRALGPGPWTLWRGRVAATADLNRWCSDACARRALNVQLQLGALPLHGTPGLPPIELLGENPGGDDVRQARAAAADVGAEGGGFGTWDRERVDQHDGSVLRETGVRPEVMHSKRGKPLPHEDIEIVDNIVTTVPKAPNEPTAYGSPQPGDHLKLEGYKATFGRVRTDHDATSNC